MDATKASRNDQNRFSEVQGISEQEMRRPGDGVYRMQGRDMAHRAAQLFD